MTREKTPIDRKWERFVFRARLFRYVPFLEFALASGSMALGIAKEDSDFDVIVGARYGRIFTVRFLSAALFGIFGWRRRRLNHRREEARDKICLNHFVTEKSYRLSPPYHPYLRALYARLVPLVGTPHRIERFFKENEEWVGPASRDRDYFFRAHRASWVARVGEVFLGGRFGDFLEGRLKTLQIRRIERGLESEAMGYKPRIVYRDAELEFHPDTRRVETWKPPVVTPHNPSQS